MKYINYLACFVASLIVLLMTGCFCSQLYTRHQVSKLMNYQGMSKKETLRRICEVDVAHYDANPPSHHGYITPANKITMTVGSLSFSVESYDEIKDSPILQRNNQWIVHGRCYGLSMRHYAIKLTFNEEGVVDKQEITYYIKF